MHYLCPRIQMNINIKTIDDMRKFTSLLTMMLVALMSLGLTSCDEDSDIAYTLDGGTWKGNMYVQYGGYDATYSVIHFNQNDGLYSGTGYWIDYFDGNYWNRHNYIANHITWTVRNRNIYISLEDEGSDVVICDYALSDSRFSGYVEASNGNRAYFELYRDSYGYNWRDYDWGYGYNSWGYSKQQASGVDTLGVMSRGAAGQENAIGKKPERKFVIK